MSGPVASGPVPSGNERAALERNLRLLPWWWVARWLWLGEGIWVLYLLEERGLTLGQVLLFESAFAAVTVVAEVPTGMVADRWGRRPSLVASGLLMAAGLVIFGLASGFAPLLLAFAIFGVGLSLMSGADDAMLFDSLAGLGRGEEFTSRAGRLNAMAWGANAATAIAGALLAEVTSLALPIVLSGGLALLAAPLALRFTEPPARGERLPFLRIGVSAARRVAGQRELWSIMLLFAAVLVAAALVFTLFQPIASELGAPVWALGAIAAAITLASAGGGWAAAATERRLGPSTTLAFGGLATVVALLAGAAGHRAVFALILLSPLMWNVLHPLVADYLARRVPDRERATVLSLNSMASQLGTAIATPIVGVIADGRGTGAALLAATAGLAIVGTAGYALWWRRGDLTLQPEGGRNIEGKGGAAGSSPADEQRA